MDAIKFLIFFVIIWIVLNKFFVRFVKRDMGIFEGIGYSLITMFLIAAMIGKYGHRSSRLPTPQEIAIVQQAQQDMRDFKNGKRNFYTNDDDDSNDGVKILEEQEDMEKDPTDLYFRR